MFELQLDAALVRELPAASPLPRQQSVWRDLAVIVGEGVTHDALIDTVTQAGGTLVRSAQLFDVYKPSSPTADMKADERSMAVRLELLDDASTLNDERIEQVVKQVVEALRSTLSARLRA